MELTKEECMCAWAFAYLDTFMAFTPEALQQHDFLGTINGSITRNLGLLKTLKNDGTKHLHAFALALTLTEHWSIKQYKAYDPVQFDETAYHYAFWATVKVLLRTAGWPSEFCTNVHMTAMCHYLVPPGELNVGELVEKALVLTAGRINKLEVFEALKFFLCMCDMEISQTPIGSNVLSKLRYNRYLGPESFRSIIVCAKAPGSLFDVVQKPFPGSESSFESKSDIESSMVPPPSVCTVEEPTAAKNNLIEIPVCNEKETVKSETVVEPSEISVSPQVSLSDDQPAQQENGAEPKPSKTNKETSEGKYAWRCIGFIALLVSVIVFAPSQKVQNSVKHNDQTSHQVVAPSQNNLKPANQISHKAATAPSIVPNPSKSLAMGYAFANPLIESCARGYSFKDEILDTLVGSLKVSQEALQQAEKKGREIYRSKPEISSKYALEDYLIGYKIQRISDKFAFKPENALYKIPGSPYKYSALVTVDANNLVNLYLQDASGSCSGEASVGPYRVRDGWINTFSFSAFFAKDKLVVVPNNFVSPEDWSLRYYSGVGSSLMLTYPKVKTGKNVVALFKKSAPSLPVLNPKAKTKKIPDSDVADHPELMYAAQYKSALDGDANSQYELSRLLRGRHIKPGGVDFLYEAAENGHHLAQYEFALYLDKLLPDAGYVSVYDRSLFGTIDFKKSLDDQKKNARWYYSKACSGGINAACKKK